MADLYLWVFIQGGPQSGAIGKLEKINKFSSSFFICILVSCIHEAELYSILLMLILKPLGSKMLQVKNIKFYIRKKKCICSQSPQNTLYQLQNINILYTDWITVDVVKKHGKIIGETKFLQPTINAKGGIYQKKIEILP